MPNTPQPAPTSPTSPNPPTSTPPSPSLSQEDAFVQELAITLYLKWLEVPPGAVLDYAPALAKEAVFAAKSLKEALDKTN